MDLLSPTMTLAMANAITGGLSNPSKMPGYAYSLPASACVTGSRLRQIPGTVCSTCYACKGRYVFSTVQHKLLQRLNAIEHPRWVDAMVYLIQASNNLYFRWHDSGDIQNEAHLTKIYQVVRACPKVIFWLPTMEYRLVRRYTLEHGVPDNLCIRVSTPKIDILRSHNDMPNRSVVVSKEALVTHRPDDVCPAPKQDNRCVLCRKCWDKAQEVVIYIKH